MNWIVSLWIMRDNPRDKVIQYRYNVEPKAEQNCQVTYGTCPTTAPSASPTKSFHIDKMVISKLKTIVRYLVELVQLQLQVLLQQLLKVQGCLH